MTIFGMGLAFVGVWVWIRQIARECEDVDARLQRRLDASKRFHVHPGRAK